MHTALLPQGRRAQSVRRAHKHEIAIQMADIDDIDVILDGVLEEKHAEVTPFDELTMTLLRHKKGPEGIKFVTNGGTLCTWNEFLLVATGPPLRSPSGTSRS